MSEFWDKVNADCNERLKLEGSPDYVAPVAEPVKPRGRGRNDNGPMPAFKPEQDREIRAKYEAPGSVNKLAQEYGVAPLTIRRAIVRAGGRMRSTSESLKLTRGPHLTAELRAEIVKRYVAGESSTYIAREHNISSFMVVELVRSAGEHVRTPSEAAKLREQRYADGPR